MYYNYCRAFLFSQNYFIQLIRKKKKVREIPWLLRFSVNYSFIKDVYASIMYCSICSLSRAEFYMSAAYLRKIVTTGSLELWYCFSFEILFFFFVTKIEKKSTLQFLCLTLFFTDDDINPTKPHLLVWIPTDDNHIPLLRTPTLTDPTSSTSHFIRHWVS